ncbi:MAG: stage 0 sporulation family protein [Pseudomonadota bacterium]
MNKPQSCIQDSDERIAGCDDSEVDGIACENDEEFDSEDCGFIEPPFPIDDAEDAYDEFDPPESTRAQAIYTVKVAGIRFGYACKIYHFDAGDLDLVAGDKVIVKTEKGIGLGQVAVAPFERVVDAVQLEALRKVIRRAGSVDFEQSAKCSHRETEAFAHCEERIEFLGLPMKLVEVECFFDGSKYVFYFTAEGRIDFRELVKQLVARFPVRIEMRQIGVRHEAKMTGGLACCGQELCCSRFLTDFRPVSVKMAKNQNLSLNPTKISGVCGRLMCCLAYEHDTYEEFKKGLPKVGKAVRTPKGSGVVVKHNPLNETVCIRLEDETLVQLTKDEILVENEPLGQKRAERDKGTAKRNKAVQGRVTKDSSPAKDS